MITDKTVLATYASRTKLSETYEVRRGRDGRIYCTCPGWKYHRRCRHLDEYEKNLEGEIVMDVETGDRVLSTTDGRTFVTTSLSDAEAENILRKSDKEFAASLLRKLAAYGSWTNNQLVWVHKLALEIINPPAKPEGVDLGDFTKIASMFEAAAVKLKYPKIVFGFEDMPITLYRAGPRSKHPGSIQVTDGGRYGDNKWYGFIDRDGKFVPSRQCLPEITEFLKLFAADPAKIAAAYGRQEGKCAFCNAGLTDERSVAAGFGPVCAKSYNLESEWKDAIKKEREAASDCN